MSGKSLAIIGVASLLLVAMVIGVTISMHQTENKDTKPDISATRKAIENICRPTDYKDTCVSTIEKGAPASDDPKDLVKAAFNVALQAISNVSKNSPLLKELEKDPKTAKAVQSCKDLFNDAADDFRRSVDEIGTFDWTNLDKILANLKIWLSATLTYQGTCLDGFDESTSEAGLKVQKLLNTTMQMSHNGIAIISGISSSLGDMQAQLQGSYAPSSAHRRLLSSSKNRRLMSWSDEFVVGHYNELVDDDLIREMSRASRGKRRLLSSIGDYSVGQDDDDDVIPRWVDLDDRRRKLLQAKTIDAVKPDIVVAQDGSGNYTKIADAFINAPKKSQKPFVIYIKEGVYREHLRLDKKPHLVLIGDGPTKTRISGDLYFIAGNMTTQDTYALMIKSDIFLAKDIGIENTSGPEKHQAVALLVQGDRAIFYNCHIDGYQDTLYVHTYRQYFRDCRVTGTIDFVFGDAAAFFQNCTFVVRKPLPDQACIVTAQGREDRRAPTGLIFHKSNIIADPDYFPVRFTNKAYLGRPWKLYSKTIFMECNIDDLISPEGWQPWNGVIGTDTCYYGEYRNEGPGANTKDRVKWPGIKTIFPSRAEKFMPRLYYEGGGGDDWILASGVPYVPSLSSDGSNFVAPPGAGDENPDDPSNIALTDIKNRYGHKKKDDKKPEENSSESSSTEESSQASSSESSPATPSIGVSPGGLTPTNSPGSSLVATSPSPTPSLSILPSDQNSPSKAVSLGPTSSISTPPSDQATSPSPTLTPSLSTQPSDQGSLEATPSSQAPGSSTLPSDQATPPSISPTPSNLPSDQNSSSEATPPPEAPSLSTLPSDQNPPSRTNLLETILFKFKNKRSLLQSQSTKD